MDDNIFICKKDIWFNRSPNHDISLMDTIYTVSSELGFEKKYDTSVLVFEKNKIYTVHPHINGVSIFSKLNNTSYFFKYNKVDNFLYFYSAFIDIKKWEKFKRKLKIKKIVKYE